MKILITSDNHLGYKETDEIRRDDTFNTFEEILKHAQSADIVIQGGDLFHDNKPSKHTLTRTTALLKKYVLGDREILIESNVPLNYEDQNLNVAVPVIAIHGNHDDPSGVGPMSAMDVLNCGGLINYVGKSDNVDKIDIKPVLLSLKGVKVAIYCLGYIRDTRLHRTFLQNRVSYHRPSDYAEWFNILVVHQNRVPHGDKDHLPEHLIDPFFDLVIYGHEHETLTYEAPNFTVIQSGSTVRTSLSEHESYGKCVYLLEVQKSRVFSVQSIPLQTVRPFIFETMKISSCAEEVVKARLEEILSSNFSLKPLIRLRIEAPDKDIFNKHKFGFVFKERVANSSEMIHFIKKNKKAEGVLVESGGKDLCKILKDLFGQVELRAIPECKFIEAVGCYVEKDDKEAFDGLCSWVIKNVIKNMGSDGLMAIEEHIMNIKRGVNKEYEFCKVQSEDSETMNVEDTNLDNNENLSEESDGFTFTKML